MILDKLFDVFQQTTDIEVKKAIILAFNGYMGVCEDINKYKQKFINFCRENFKVEEL